MLVLAWVAGYLEGKAEPSDASTLLVAGQMVDQTARRDYLSPGQMATILLPRATRLMNRASNFLGLIILATAILTTWWLWFPAVFFRLVSSVIAENVFANWSLDYNCFWIAADLSRRKADYLAKGDQERAEASEDLLDEFTLFWEDIHDNDEIVPRRMDVAKMLGVRRSM